MRKLGLLAATCVILFLVTSMTAPYETKYIVAPGDVVKSREIDPNHPQMRITGSVTLEESPSGSDSSTAKRGGGCLIYLPPQATTCTEDSICKRRINVGTVLESDQLGYCASTSNHGHPPPVPKACWYKPEPASCFQSPTADLVVNQPHKFNPISINPPDVPGSISWRVVSCQNLVAGGCANRTLNGFVYRYGTIRKFP